jgi:hypothetical protein
VDDERPPAGAGPLAGEPGRPARVGGQRGDVDRRQAARRDQLALGGRRLRRAVAEQHDVVVAQERPPRTNAGQPRIGARDIEQVGHAGPVERAVRHRRGGVEIGVQVEVDEAGLGARRHRAGDRA